MNFSDTLLDVFDWLELTVVGAAIRDSIWLFPAIEAVHLLALAVMGGAVLMVDLRLLGFGLNSRTVTEVAQDAKPWFQRALMLMFATGIPLFLSEAVKCFYNFSFWVKMSALLVAILFTYLVRARVVSAEVPVGITQKTTGLVSMALWFCVAAAGRWIGFS